MSDLSKIVYLSAAQYETLKTNGSITVGSTTINYSNDDLYLTPDTTVPTGGTTGQVLTKASNSDYDTVWTSIAPVQLYSGSQISTEDTNATLTDNISNYTSLTFVGNYSSGGYNYFFTQTIPVALFNAMSSPNVYLISSGGNNWLGLRPVDDTHIKVRFVNNASFFTVYGIK